MTTRPDKAAVNNSGDKAIGITLSLDQITKAEAFASLFIIKPEVLAAIKADMAVNGFDPSKPVNVWKKPDGSRILIDGYTRVSAAESLGLLHVTAYEKTFASEADALAYAIHTQRDPSCRALWLDASPRARREWTMTLPSPRLSFPSKSGNAMPEPMGTSGASSTPP
ncbi:MAG: ParB/Srx family N-terminal domain-containing protein [Spirochaetota bacterium]